MHTRKAKLLALELLPNDYVDRWFNASTFFNTQDISEVFKHRYFITHDLFMGSHIYALRFINQKEGTIDTIAHGSKEKCLIALKAIKNRRL